MSDPIAKNHGYWDRVSDDYQEAHGAELEATALAWGVWRIPEADVCVLGEVVDRDVLELGCGAAQWAVGLRQSGARVTGLDLSRRQLVHAQQRCSGCETTLALTQASAESIPFAGGSFDIVLSDHGATTFARPERVLPEVARVLRPGGVFAFAITSPIRDICWAEDSDTISEKLELDYFGMSELEDSDQVCFQRPFGEWVALFRASGFQIEALHELRPPADATTTYEGFVPTEWARRWPAENLWQLRRRLD